jgi:hypothetical protein
MNLDYNSPCLGGSSGNERRGEGSRTGLMAALELFNDRHAVDPPP